MVKELKKDHTKVLALSGTPFNLLDKFGEDNVYTWDYVMEQKKKNEWNLTHHGDHNPYADLPKMHIYTYDLGEKLKKYVSDEYDTKAFNFREFFKVWYKGPNGNRELPKNAVEGRFVHENDVKAFLDLMVKEDTDSGYPYSTKEYRDMFRHTLWMVPGVKEAQALSKLLRKHPVFEHFGIANVVGEGDKYEEEHAKDALELVCDTIKNYDYSITLSCGKLTTGVTVKEWTAVLMLSGSYSTAAAQYMQTIFRVQSAGTIDGKQKTDCYTIVSARGTYRTTNAFNIDYPDAIDRLGKGTGNMLVSNFFEKLPEVIVEKSNDSCLRILCRVNGKRSICNIPRKYIQSNEFIDKYNVASPEANSNGRSHTFAKLRSFIQILICNVCIPKSGVNALFFGIIHL